LAGPRQYDLELGEKPELRLDIDAAAKLFNNVSVRVISESRRYFGHASCNAITESFAPDPVPCSPFSFEQQRPSAARYNSTGTSQAPQWKSGP
jgi:hypothetical protein